MATSARDQLEALAAQYDRIAWSRVIATHFARGLLDRLAKHRLPDPSTVTMRDDRCEVCMHWSALELEVQCTLDYDTNELTVDVAHLDEYTLNCEQFALSSDTAHNRVLAWVRKLTEAT